VTASITALGAFTLRTPPFARPSLMERVEENSSGQLRRDLTIELISQLNEIDKVNAGTGAGRLKLHRIVENLILQACGIDERDAEGNITKRQAFGRFALVLRKDRSRATKQLPESCGDR
jgi:hypothetical protein